MSLFHSFKKRSCMNSNAVCNGGTLKNRNVDSAVNPANYAYSRTITHRSLATSIELEIALPGVSVFDRVIVTPPSFA